MHLAGVFIYPVKSLRGVSVPHCDVDELGLVGDRRFLIVDPQDRFLTQRALPRMALIETILRPDTLTLSSEGAGHVTVGRAPDSTARVLSVSIWKSEGLLAEDCGDEPAQWLTAFLRTPCRLVRLGPRFLRPILKETAGPGDRVGFADAFPFLAVSEASLDTLNDRLIGEGGEPVPMNRFRPNLVLAGCTAHTEDTWPRLQIGSITFRAGGPCIRCVITTTNQFTAERGPEPLRTLATYRRDPASPGEVQFGQNLLHETKRGTLTVGDPIRLLA